MQNFLRWVLVLLFKTTTAQEYKISCAVVL